MIRLFAALLILLPFLLKAQDFAVTKFFNVYFEFDTDTLNDTSKDSLLHFFSKKTRVVQYINGYTDNKGTDTYNISLSERRALHVKNILVTKGLITDSISIAFYGKQFADSNYNHSDRTVAVYYLIDTTAFTLKEKISYSNIYFEPDKAIIQPHSFSELQVIEKALRQYPDCIYEIVGHVNYPKDKTGFLPEKFWHLSVNRAKLIYKLLIEKGIHQQQLRYRGAGNRAMVHPYARTNTQKQQNMRVEVYIYCSD